MAERVATSDGLRAQAPRPGRGSGPVGRDGLRVEPPPSGSRRRVPELILGILLVAGGALGAVLLAVSGRSRDDVVALRNDVARGEVIEASDLVSVKVGSDGGVTYLSSGDAGTVVGQVALTDMPAGVLVAPEMFGEPAELLEPGSGRVGLMLAANQMPTLDLAVGDHVSVVVPVESAAGEAQVIAEADVALVEEQPATGQGRLWYVSLVAPQTQAVGIASAAAGGSNVQLVLHGSDE